MGPKIAKNEKSLDGIESVSEAFLGIKGMDERLARVNYSIIEQVLIAYHNALSTITTDIPSNTLNFIKGTLDSIGNYIRTAQQSGLKVPRGLTELYAKAKASFRKNPSVKVSQ